MAENDDRHLACPHCGRRYIWKRGLAGGVVRCKCGEGFRVPLAAGEQAEAVDISGAGGADEPARAEEAEAEFEDDNTYALNLPDEPANPAADAHAGSTTPANDSKCANCNQRISPQAVVCVKCGFDLQQGCKMRTQVETDAAASVEAARAADRRNDGDASSASATTSRKEIVGEEEGNREPPGRSDASVASLDPRAALASIPDPIHTAEESAGARATATEAARQQKIELYVPAVLIALGLAMHFVDDFFFSGGDVATGAAGAILSAVLQVVLWVPLAFIGMLIAVKLLDVSFGTLGMAIYKLVGIALGPGAVWSICIYVMPPALGWLVGLFVSLGLYFAMVKLLFDLDGRDTIMLIVIIFVLQIFAVVLGYAIVMTMIHAMF